MFTFKLEQTAIAPGSEIRGTVRWEFPAPAPEWIEVRLIWYTEGKGDRDLGIAAIHKTSSPDPAGETAFSLMAPRYPNSFSGKLISVCWALEAIAFPGLEATQCELVIGPGGQELTPDALKEFNAPAETSP